jgi:carboxyl-terminal processing protease
MDAARRSAVRAAAVFAAAVAATTFLSVHLTQREPGPSNPWPEDARREVQALVETRYVEPVTPDRADELFDAAMRGYVQDLDPFSRYFSAAERAALDEDLSGRFSGVGVHVETVPAGLLVTAVRRGGPADAAGIVPGDVIEKAGDVALAGRNRTDMVEMIKGPAGTHVLLAVRGAGGAVRVADTVRAEIDSDIVPAVRVFDGEPGVGYLRVAMFAEATAPEVREAVKSLVRKGVGGIVLDLRRNLGGVVQSAVDVGSLFLPPETLVCSARSRDGVREHRTRAAEGVEPTALPLVVLVDEQTASASEILAGALQDHGRAVLLGGRTYGKFVMQTVVPLEHRGAALRLTTSRYETPHGRSDQRDEAHDRLGGLLPDVHLPVRSRDEDDAIRLEFARQCGPAWTVLAGKDGSSDPPDRQLAAALALLRGGEAPPEPVSPRAN